MNITFVLSRMLYCPSFPLFLIRFANVITVSTYMKEHGAKIHKIVSSIYISKLSHREKKTKY